MLRTTHTTEERLPPEWHKARFRVNQAPNQPSEYFKENQQTTQTPERERERGGGRGEGDT